MAVHLPTVSTPLPPIGFAGSHLDHGEPGLLFFEPTGPPRPSLPPGPRGCPHPGFFALPRSRLLSSVSACYTLARPAATPSALLPTYDPLTGLTATGWGSSPSGAGLPPSAHPIV